MPTATKLASAGLSVLLIAAASFSAGVAWSSPQQAVVEAVPAADPKPSPPSKAERPTEKNRVTKGTITSLSPGGSELQFVQLAQCRLADTRKTSKLGKSSTRSFYAARGSKIKAQGGKSGGCGVPASATAIVATVLVYKPSAAGRLKAWAVGSSAPAGDAVYYSKASTTSQLTIPLRSGTGKNFSIKNFSSKTDLAIDVIGYYVPPMAAYIGPSGNAVDHSGRLVSSTRTATGEYTLVWDRDITSCTGVASPDLTGYVTTVYTQGNISYVYVWTNSASPAKADYWVNVLISC